MPMKVLISGGSIAGCCTIYWLLRTGVDVEITMVERASELRRNGQSIDIRNSAVNIMREMGIEQAVRDHSTNEEGMAFIDAKGKRIATMLASGDPEKQTFTSEFEILRGDLGGIMYDLVKDDPRVTCIFGDTISTFRNESDGVHVEFNNNTPSTRYDLLVGADGLGSKTRAIAFNTTTRAHSHSLITYLAFWSMKEDALDGSAIATWFAAPGGRSVLLRSNPTGETHATASFVMPDTQKGRADLDAFLAAEKQGPAELKTLIAKRMQNAGGHQTDRVIKSMFEATDFYSSELAQIKLPQLNANRVTLVGDAGYCPTAFTGMGTSLAMIGSYILAGEISKNPTDIPAALKAYSDIMLPISRKVQTLPPGTPRPFNPQTAWGISVRNWIFWFVFTFKIDFILTKLAGAVSMSDDKLPVPTYAFKK